MAGATSFNSFKNKFAGSYSYLFLALAGLSFCFFLGFPFANQNESYKWVPVLDKVTLGDVLTKQVLNIESFRPLGMANGWLSYKLSGNIYLQQLLNWLFAISSFTLLFAYTKNKPVFSIIAFVSCACFFPGYIYLFHLHGVFYGPFQLYTAMLACIAISKQSLSAKMLIALTVVTLVVSLYHTFALLVFCAFLCGYIVQAFKTKTTSKIAGLAIMLVVTIVFTKLILNSREFKSLQQLTDGFFASYRLSELNGAFSFLSFLLTILTTLPVTKSTRARVLLSSAVAVLCMLSMSAHIPVVLLWIAACMLVSCIKGNWPIAAMLAATAILPFASGTGSPTYCVFVLMLCVFVTANENVLLQAPRIFSKLASLAVVMLLGVFLLIKANVKVPGISAIAKPILADKEKTHQLATIIAWKLSTKECAFRSLQFIDATELPVNATNAVERQNRPPTRQQDLTIYMDSTEAAPVRAGQLYITFGDKMLNDKKLLYTVPGRWNGNAYVFQ